MAKSKYSPEARKAARELREKLQAELAAGLFKKAPDIREKPRSFWWKH